jgi:hypothetical protein
VPPIETIDSPAWAGNLSCIEDGAAPLPFDLDEAFALISG